MLSILLMSACTTKKEEDMNKKGMKFVDEFLNVLVKGDISKAKEYLADEVEIEIKDNIEKTTFKKNDLLKIDLLGDIGDQIISIAITRFFKGHQVLDSEGNEIRVNIKTLDYEKIIERIKTIDYEKLLTSSIPTILATIFTSGIEAAVDKIIDLYSEVLGNDFKDLCTGKTTLDNEIVFTLIENNGSYLIKSIKK